MKIFNFNLSLLILISAICICSSKIQASDFEIEVRYEGYIPVLSKTGGVYFVKAAPFSIDSDKNLSTSNGDLRLLGVALDESGHIIEQPGFQPGVDKINIVNLKNVDFKKCEHLHLSSDGILIGCDSTGEYKKLYQISVVLFNTADDGSYLSGNPNIKLVGPGTYSSDRFSFDVPYDTSNHFTSVDRGFFQSGYPILRYH
ncbi:MAG: hypothetical protein JWQ35_1325 [Bacteriovoracaceae bacterium]|nr:hypothetical protein [Bacteriovoracaceae bacterium]